MSARLNSPQADPARRQHGLLTLATAAGGSSFVDFLGSAAPELLPRPHPDAALAPHGTTIVAALFADGVVLAGDRRATMGNLIAQRDIDKVFATDDYSLVGIAGTAGTAIEIVRLFQVELEHYEKIEGTQLTLDGKANRLSTMIRGNLGAAMQGLAVVPLFAGYDIAADIAADEAADEAADTVSDSAVDSPADTPGDGAAVDGFGGPARIYSYDVTGGRYPERYYHSVGSGSVFAKGSLKKLWRPDMSRADVIRVVVTALYDAADDDSATGGPDVSRGIYPVVRIATAAGTERVKDDELADVVAALIAERTERPGS